MVDLNAMRAELRRDEGEKLHAYTDSLGFLTIGIGRLIDERKGGGITPEESAYLLDNDIKSKMGELDRRMPWWRSLDGVRQRAVLNMAFQLGVATLAGTPTFKLVASGNFDMAADRLQGWKWAQQTPARAQRVIAMMRTGKA
jgi:lysozyme